MNIRNTIIKATALFVVIGAMAALLAYNSPDTERKETASKVDYRTYCYGQNADATTHTTSCFRYTATDKGANISAPRLNYAETRST